MAGDTSRWTGIPDLRQALKDLPEKLRKRALRNALAAGARIVRDDAKAHAPILKEANPYRKAGTMRDAISVRTSKMARREGNVGVFVNVKPYKGGRKGEGTFKQLQVYKRAGRLVSRAVSQNSSRFNPKDPYYWRWIEFGWTPARGKRGELNSKGGDVGKIARRRARMKGAPAQVPGVKFLTNAANKFPQAIPVIFRNIVAFLKKLNEQKGSA